MRAWPALAVVMAASLLGCSALGPRPAEVTDAGGAELDPPPSGGVVEISSGEAGATDWLVVAYVAESGELCLAEIVSGSMAGSTCGLADRRGDVIGPLVISPFIGDDGTILSVMVDAEARAVRIESSTGSADVDVVSLERIGVNLVAAALHLPPGVSPTGVVALDGGGGELSRQDLGPGL